MKKKKKNKLILLLGFVLTIRLLTNQFPEVLFYAIIFGILITFFFAPQEVKLENKSILVFVVVIFSGIIFNDIPSFLKPYPRFTSFLMNIVVFSPIFFSARLQIFRKNLFFTICELFSIYTVVSFAGLLVGLFPLEGLGGFQGITVHAMSLSIVAAISLLFNIMKFLDDRKKIYILFIGISFIVLILGASRAALIGSLFGFIMLLLKFKNFKVATIRPLLASSLILGISLFIIPDQYFGRLNSKFESSENAGNAFSSREKLWDSRIMEFKDSPIYGIGFGNIIEKYNEYGLNKETGAIETGSSWGMILSMTGLLGIITFTILIITRSSFMIKNNNSLHNSLILGIFIFFVIHMMFEGYIFASGSIFMIFFWLTTSMTHYNFKRK